MGIERYSTSPGNNTDIDGINIAEGCPPSTINNAIRQDLANQRAWYNDSEWVQYGDGDGQATITFVSATSFSIGGVDVTDEYHAGRRVKAEGAVTGTIYGTIESSAFVTSTTVNVVWDSGQLQNEALTIYLGILRAQNPSLPNPSNQTIRGTGNALLNIIGGDAAIIHLEDEGAAENEKIYQLLVNDGEVILRSRNDDGTAKETILTIDANRLMTLLGRAAIVSDSESDDELLTIERNSATAYADDDKFLLTLQNSTATADAVWMRWLSSGRSHAAGILKGTVDWVLRINTTGTPVNAIRVNGTTGEVSFAGNDTIVDASLGATGWVEYSNGLIWQWGTTTLSGGNILDITLPRTYPSQHFCAWGNDGNQGALQTNMWAFPITRSQIRLGFGDGNSLTWLSVGR